MPLGVLLTSLSFGCQSPDPGGADGVDASTGMAEGSTGQDEAGTDAGPETDTDADTGSEFDGIWISRGYGYAVEVVAGQFERFEVTESSCISAARGPLEAFLAVAEVARTSEETLRVSTGFTPFVFDRATALPQSCASGPIPLVGDDGYQRDALRAFEVLSQTFSEQYAFFELRQVDWEAASGQARAGLTAASSDAVLFEALTRALEPLGDGHASLTSPDDDYESGSVEFEVLLTAEHSESGGPGSFDEYAEGQFGAHLEGISNALQDSQGAGDATVWGRLEDNIGYLGFFDFEPDDEDESLAELDAALQSLSDADALVIDLRYNSGGSDEYALQVASRFFDQERLVFSKAARDGDSLTAFADVSLAPFAGETYAQPLYVLTTNSTVSAAEIFTLSMAQLPQVTIAGHRSNGILSDVLDRTLPNGWTFSLSNEVYRSPSGEVFEAVGVPVDLEIDLTAFPLEDRVNHHDSWLEEIRAQFSATRPESAASGGGANK